MQKQRIAIIGGGPGGLITAYRLGQSDPSLDITLFEASPRVGGKIMTARFDEPRLSYEAGAAELYDYSQTGPDPLRELVQELGLSIQPLQGKAVAIGDTIVEDDHAIAKHFGDATAKAVADFTAKARQLINPEEYYESDWQTDNADPLATQPFSELLEKVPDATARRYIQSSIHSDLATEPHQTDSMYGLQNYLMNEPEYMRLYTIDGGIEQLVHALRHRIKANILLNHRVLSVQRQDNECYQIGFSHKGLKQQAEFDYVVVALPNNWIPTIDWKNEDLSRAMSAHHAHYDYPAHYLRVTILFSQPFWREQISGSYFMLDAFGGCCVYDEASRTKGSKLGILGWLIAGEAALNMANLPEQVLIDRVLDSLPACIRHGKEFMMEARINRWLGSVNGRPGGRPMREPDSRHQPDPENHPELFVVGDYLFDSTLNGVVDSADTVVEWILEEVREESLSNTR